MGRLILLIVLSCSLLMACQQEGGSHKKTTGEGDTADSLSQSVNPLGPGDQFVKRYDGSIDGKGDFEMTLVNWGNGFLTGWYEEEKSGKRVQLNGEIDLDESVVLDEFTEDEPSGRFNFDWQDLTRLKGSWTDLSGNAPAGFKATEVVSDSDKRGWSGSWYLNGIWDGGVLIIGNVTGNSFDFGLSVVRNAHLGEIAQRCHLDGDKAVLSVDFNQNNEPCELIFHHRGDHITLEQKSSPWACGFGARAYVGGDYEKQKKEIKPRISYGGENDIFRTEEEHDAFTKMVGEKGYELIAYNMQHQELREPEDGQFVICEGWIYGLASSHKAIIVRDGQDRFQAAVTDYIMDGKPVIRYYVTGQLPPKEMVPPIKEWRAPFEKYEVIYQ